MSLPGLWEAWKPDPLIRKLLGLSLAGAMTVFAWAQTKATTAYDRASRVPQVEERCEKMEAAFSDLRTEQRRLGRGQEALHTDVRRVISMFSVPATTVPRQPPGITLTPLPTTWPDNIRGSR